MSVGFIQLLFLLLVPALTLLRARAMTTLATA